MNTSVEPTIRVSNPTELRSYVEARTIAVVNMWAVRLAFGVGRLTAGPAGTGATISKKLREQHRIGHLPTTLPNDQFRFVTLYQLDTPFGQMLEKMANPEPADEDAIRDRIAGIADDTAARKLDQIRALVNA